MSQTNQCSSSGSPTSRLLLEYEMHLRNTLAKGMDAESFSLHTFEALLSQSMENLEFAESLPFPNRGGTGSLNKSSTMPSSHRNISRIPLDRDRDGYYSDRNEMIRDKERDKGYLSDHNTRYFKLINSFKQIELVKIQSCLVTITQNVLPVLASLPEHNGSDIPTDGDRVVHHSAPITIFPLSIPV